MNDSIPAEYRRLLATYPAVWRRDHGDVVLATLMELHTDLGRSHPTALERLEFALAGISHRLALRSRPHAAQATNVLGLAGESFHFIDQSNGLYPEPQLDERSQLRQNAVVDRNDAIELATANAPIGLIIR